MTNNERDHAEYTRRIREDDSREDTCGCSRAGWEWYEGVALLAKLAVMAFAGGFVIWFLAKQIWA